MVSVVFGVVVECSAARNAPGFLVFLSQVCKLQHFPVNHIGRLRFSFLFLTVIFLCVRVCCVSVCLCVHFNFLYHPFLLPLPSIHDVFPSLYLLWLAIFHIFVMRLLLSFYFIFICVFVFAIAVLYSCLFCLFFVFVFLFFLFFLWESGRCDRNSLGK